ATVDFAKAFAISFRPPGIPVYSEFKHILEYVEQPDGKIVYAHKFQRCATTCDQVGPGLAKVIPVLVVMSLKGFNSADPEFMDLHQMDGLLAKLLGVIMSSPQISVVKLPRRPKMVYSTPNSMVMMSQALMTMLRSLQNLFYVSNLMHDITYQYVVALTMNPIHEYGHGVSNRLLVDLPLAGVSEQMSQESSDTATTSIPMGTYVVNIPEGIRSHPYTTDMKVNPLTYGDLATRDEVHDIGEVWASMLWEVYWSLVTKHGFSANLHDAKQSEGNIVAMQNIIGGMMLQPCNPTFLSARDAVIAADAAHYKGANKCEILKHLPSCNSAPNHQQLH
ncbi:hypothetical protein BSLG_010738, partial [Batrachochytrium salamandrivorans]